MEYTVVTENDKGFGPLKWFGNSRNAASAGAALLGRAVAIYDYKMNFNSDLELLVNDLHARRTKFRNVNIWTETDNSKVRRAWMITCFDHPGKGLDAVMEADVTLEEVQKWYDFEYDGLTDDVLIDKVMKALWGGDFVQFSKDLCIHGRVVHLWRTWGQIPGSDIHKVLEYAFLSALHLDKKGIGGEILTRSKDTYIEEEALPYRKEFIRAWKKAEDALISVAVPKRQLITFEETENDA